MSKKKKKPPKLKPRPLGLKPAADGERRVILAAMLVMGVMAIVAIWAKVR